MMIMMTRMLAYISLQDKLSGFPDPKKIKRPKLALSSFRKGQNLKNEKRPNKGQIFVENNKNNFQTFIENIKNMP